MASNPPSERDVVRASVQAREEVSPPQTTDSDVTTEISEGVRLQHALDDKKEVHRHKEVRFDKLIELAPVIIAAIVVVLGFAVFIGSMLEAAWQAKQAEFWAKQGERGISTAVAALAYIFGKGTKPAN